MTRPVQAATTNIAATMSLGRCHPTINVATPVSVVMIAPMTAPGWAAVITVLVGYGHLLIGLSLLSGLLVRVSAIFGIGLMLVYWMAHLDFPYVSDTNNFLIDEHIVDALVLGLLIAQRAGHAFGLDEWAAKLPAVRQNRWLGWATA